MCDFTVSHVQDYILGGHGDFLKSWYESGVNALI